MIVKSEVIGGKHPGAPRLVLAPGNRFCILMGTWISRAEASGRSAGIITVKGSRNFHEVAVRYTNMVGKLGIDNTAVLCFGGESWDSSLSTPLRRSTEGRYALKTFGFGSYTRLGGFSMWEYFSKTWGRGTIYTSRRAFKASFGGGPRISGTAETSWFNLVVNTVLQILVMTYLLGYSVAHAISQILTEGDDAVSLVHRSRLRRLPVLQPYESLLCELGIRPTSVVAHPNAAVPPTDLHSDLVQLGVCLNREQVGSPEFCSRYFFISDRGIWSSIHSPKRLGGKPFCSTKPNSTNWGGLNKAVSLSNILLTQTSPVYSTWALCVYRHWQHEQVRECDIDGHRLISADQVHSVGLHRR